MARKTQIDKLIDELVLEREPYARKVEAIDQMLATLREKQKANRKSHDDASVEAGRLA